MLTHKDEMQKSPMKYINLKLKKSQTPLRNLGFIGY